MEEKEGTNIHCAFPVIVASVLTDTQAIFLKKIFNIFTYLKPMANIDNHYFFKKNLKMDKVESKKTSSKIYSFVWSEG